MMFITGTETQPCKTGVALIDIITGLYAQNAILAAIISRNNNPDRLGQKIDINLFDCCVASLAIIGSNYLIGNKEAKRWGTAHANIVPYQGFKCLDQQFIIIGIGYDRQFREFCQLLNMEYSSDDDRFETNKDRVNHRDILIPILNEKFMECTRDKWLKILEGSTIPNAPINNMEDVFNDKHLKERGLVKNVQYGIDGEIQIVGLPVEFSRDKQVSEIKRHPPMLGENNKEIVCDLLGFDDSYLVQ